MNNIELRNKAAIAVLPQCIQDVQEILKSGRPIIENTVAKQAAVMAVQYANALVEELTNE